MQAARSNAFALKTSGLDAFLYADVGAEANGSTLTILSVLARLGKDPWAEAERWAGLPKAAVIEALAHCIAQMPLAPLALAGARESAARLAQLLPRATQSLPQASAAQPARATPKWALLTMIYFAFAVGMAINVLLMPRPPADLPAAIHQSTATPVASQAASSPTVRDSR